MLIAPALVCLDCQRFVREPSSAAVEDVDQVIARIAQALTYARTLNWTVIHAQMKAPAGVLSRASPSAGPIETLRPRRDEFVFEHVAPSAYDATSFARVMDERFGAAAFLVGFDHDGAAAATLADARSLGHRLLPVVEAIGRTRGAQPSGFLGGVSLATLPNAGPAAGVIAAKPAL